MHLSWVSKDLRLLSNIIHLTPKMQSPKPPLGGHSNRELLVLHHLSVQECTDIINHLTTQFSGVPHVFLLKLVYRFCIRNSGTWQWLVCDNQRPWVHSTRMAGEASSSSSSSSSLDGLICSVKLSGVNFSDYSGWSLANVMETFSSLRFLEMLEVEPGWHMLQITRMSSGIFKYP